MSNHDAKPLEFKTVLTLDEFQALTSIRTIECVQSQDVVYCLFSDGYHLAVFRYWHNGMYHFIRHDDVYFRMNSQNVMKVVSTDAEFKKYLNSIS